MKRFWFDCSLTAMGIHRLHRSCSYLRQCCRTYSKVLGIETSCDDTGCAIVDTDRKVLGECLRSQQQIHLEYVTVRCRWWPICNCRFYSFGGIIPPVARDLHKQNIDSVVTQAMQRAQVDLNDLDAIAVTVKPGLPLSLLVGMNYAKELSIRSSKPLIPIHHMEAHALTARLVDEVTLITKML